MKKIALSLLLVSALLSCEEKKNDSECEDRICTEEFRSLVIKFVDNKGVAAKVKKFSVVNQRTGENVYANSAIALNLIEGTFIIADDGNTKSLSEAGDNLKIIGISAETNQTKSALVKVKGGKCACHIEKVSGPEQVAFD